MRRTTRRQFLRDSTDLAAASVAASLAPGAFARGAEAAKASGGSSTRPASGGGGDPTTREEFDRLDRAWNDGNANSDKLNTAGELGWGQSGALAAYLLMYRAHGDKKYLDKLIGQFDRVLAHRDSVRGVKDYRGELLPAWQSAGHYTCGAATLNDAAGRPVLQIRCGARPVTKVTVEVTDDGPGVGAGVKAAGRSRCGSSAPTTSRSPTLTSG